MTGWQFSLSAWLILGVLPGVSSLPGQTSGVWRLQSPLPTGRILHAVEMVSDSEGWTVGDAGAILHTTNGGVTWKHQSSGTTAQLEAVRFLDSLHGWAAGNGVVFTTDGGQTWRRGSYRGTTLYGVYFVNANTGWVVGGSGTIAKSTDGGSTWALETSPTSQNLLSVTFADANNGWAVGGNGVIIHTSNAGVTWSKQTSGTSDFLEGVTFVDASSGWAAGGNVVLHTADGGASWQPQSVPANTWVDSVFFLDTMNGWAAGTSQNIIHTADGGVTWVTQFGGLNTGPYDTYPLNGIRFGDANHGIAVGNAGNIFTTSDGGQTWTDEESGSPTQAFAITAKDAEHAWSAQANGVLLYTTDGGQNWTRTNLFETDGNANVSAVSFVDNLNGWATSTEGFPNSVWHSADGGHTWNQQNSGGVGTLFGIDAINLNSIVAVGGVSSGIVIRSGDGGATWQVIHHPPVGAFLSAVQFVNNTTGWLVGAENVIQKSTDGGLTWTAQTKGPTNGSADLFAVSFADVNNGWAVGGLGSVFHTSDGGSTWIAQKPGVPTSEGMPIALDGVHAVSADIAWISGFGYVARTTDGGNTWDSEDFFPADTSFPTVFFVDADRAWVGGTGGIYHRMPSAK